MLSLNENLKLLIIMPFARNKILNIEEAKDFQFLSRFFKLDKKDIIALELSNSFILFDLVRILSTMIILFFILNGFFVFVNKNILVFIFSSLALFFTTGTNVFFQKAQIEYFDNVIIELSNKTIVFGKLSLLEKITLSSKSSHEIKFKYVLIANAQVILLNILILFILTISSYSYIDKNTNFSLAEKILLTPSLLFFSDNFTPIIILTLSLIVYFIVLPTPSFQSEIKNKNNLEGIFRANTFMILLLTIIQISVFSYQIYQGATTSERNLSFPTLLYLIIYYVTILQGCFVTILHFHNTISAIKKNNTRQYWLLENILILPYYLYYYLFIHLIPLTFICLIAWLVHKLFKISLYFFKFSSPIRIIGFIIGFLLIIYNCFYKD